MFPPFLIISTIFAKRKFIAHKICVLIFSTIFLKIFFILLRIEKEIVVNVHRSSRKVPVTLVLFS